MLFSSLITEQVVLVNTHAEVIFTLHLASKVFAKIVLVLLETAAGE